MNVERDIVIGKPFKKDLHHSFCSFTECYTPERLPEDTTCPDLLVPLVFSSRSQCRKAGYDEIENGFTDVYVGKLKHRFTILKRII